MRNSKNVSEKDAQKYLQSLDSMDPDLLLLIGYCYFCGIGTAENLCNAVHYYTLSAQLGNSEAQWRLGACYQFGCGIPENSQLAFYWYCKSRDQNNTLGKIYLARLFFEGIGCPRDEKQGFDLLLSAAEADCYDAFMDIAGKFYDGSANRLPDRKRAKFWLLKALDSGLVEAEEALNLWDWGNT